MAAPNPLSVWLQIHGLRYGRLYSENYPGSRTLKWYPCNLPSALMPAFIKQVEQVYGDRLLLIKNRPSPNVYSRFGRPFMNLPSLTVRIKEPV